MSHHHEDHAGFAASLRELSDCRIIAHQDAMGPLQKGEHFIPRQGGIVNRRVILFSYYLFLTKKVRLKLKPLEIMDGYSCIFISDVEQYYESWQKVIDEGGRTIYSAHGPPFSYRELERNMHAFSQEDLIKKRPSQ